MTDMCRCYGTLPPCAWCAHRMDQLAAREIEITRAERRARGRGHLNCQVTDCDATVLNGHHCARGHMQTRDDR